jgi:hypothetical protein
MACECKVEAALMLPTFENAFDSRQRNKAAP